MQHQPPVHRAQSSKSLDTLLPFLPSQSLSFDACHEVCHNNVTSPPRGARAGGEWRRWCNLLCRHERLIWSPDSFKGPTSYWFLSFIILSQSKVCKPVVMQALECIHECWIQSFEILWNLNMFRKRFRQQIVASYVNCLALTLRLDRTGFCNSLLPFCKTPQTCNNSCKHLFPLEISLQQFISGLSADPATVYCCKIITTL